MTEKTIPNGYWEDANGALIPVSKIKDIDKDRHRTVSDLCQAAAKQHAELARFKAAAMAEVSDFIDRSLAQYEVQHGGKKGNVTLVSFDGRFKVGDLVKGTVAKIASFGAFVSLDGLYRAVGEPGRNPAYPQYCDACFSGEYPTNLRDNDEGRQFGQLSLLMEQA